MVSRINYLKCDSFKKKKGTERLKQTLNFKAKTISKQLLKRKLGLPVLLHSFVIW